MFLVLGSELVALFGTATTPILNLPMAGTILVVPLSGVLMTVYALLRVRDVLRWPRGVRAAEAPPLPPPL
jgi:TRAP-type C4-dicarboxylate transport system permease small subunit